MAKEANFKAIAKQIVKQVARSERLVCFVLHVDNDVVVATNYYMLVISQEVFKRDFKSDVKLGRYENFFYEMGGFDYKVSNMHGTVETKVLNKNTIDSIIMNTFNEYFVEKFGKKEDKFVPVCLTTVNINSNDTTYTLFKRKNKSLLCINKDYIDMLIDTPLNALYGCSTVTLNDDKRYNPICYRTCYGEVDNKLRFHGFLVLPCSVDADSVLKHVLGME